MAKPERIEGGRFSPGNGASLHDVDCGCVRCVGFQPGHSIVPTFSHGAYSPRAMSPRATEIEEWCYAVAPWLAPADGPTVTLFAQTLARIEAGHGALGRVDEAADTELGPYLGAGALPFDRLRRDVRAWTNQAMKLAAELGMTPAARARLQLDVAATKRTLSLVDLHEAARAEAEAEAEAQPETIEEERDA